MSREAERQLNELHEVLAKTLLNAVKTEGVNAAVLNVARQFLKDNGIDGIPKDTNDLGELAKRVPFNGADDLDDHDIRP
jgi:hypothetical protein